MISNGQIPKGVVLNPQFGIPNSRVRALTESEWIERIAAALKRRIGDGPMQLSLRELSARIGHPQSQVHAWKEGKQLINSFDLDRLYLGLGPQFEFEVRGEIDPRRYGFDETAIRKDQTVKNARKWFSPEHAEAILQLEEAA